MERIEVYATLLHSLEHGDVR